MIKQNSVQDIKPLYDVQAILLIDVREPEEHAQQRIPGAQLISLSTFDEDDVPPLDNPNNLPIVVHCRSGKRSYEACRRWVGEDPSLDIANMEGGILAWKEAGFSVV